MTAITMPTIFINGYIGEKLSDNSMTAFFPASPTAIDDFTEQFPEGNKFYVYDRMLKMRRRPFPHIKEEQMLIYFYARDINQYLSGVEEAYISTQKIVDLLDRGDESAEEVNNWITSKLVDGVLNPGQKVFAVGDDPSYPDYREFNPVYFHEFKVFQLEETADIIDFGTARTWAANKLIVDYKYHISKDQNNV